MSSEVNIDREELVFKLAIAAWGIDLVAGVVLMCFGILLAGFVMFMAAVVILLVVLAGVLARL